MSKTQSYLTSLAEPGSDEWYQLIAGGTYDV